MFKKWFGRNKRSNMFELVTEDHSVRDHSVRDHSVRDHPVRNQVGVGKRRSAQLGQLEALSKPALVRYADQQSEKIKALTKDVGLLNRQNALHKKLRDQRDTSKDSSKQLARIEREREGEAQYQRDQFQIRMKELSLRVAELEGQLLHSNAENERLKSLLRKIRDQIAPRVTNWTDDHGACVIGGKIDRDSETTT